MKFYADEMITHRFVPLLRAFDPNNEYYTIVECFGTGAKDPVWMKALSEMPGKVALLTYERNLLKDSLCAQYYREGSIYIVYLRGGWMDLPMNTQMWMLIKAWPDVLSAIGKSEHPATFLVYPKGCRVRRR